jgi:predicted nuclease with RNAse H fold
MKVLGVDVALSRLDAVLLDDQRAVLSVHRNLSPDALRDLVQGLEPHLVAIDSPARWASPTGRETEHVARKLNIQLYATPTLENLSPNGFHSWMLTGIAAFRAIADLYPLFDGGSYLRKAIEIFPHASAVVLAGHLKPHQKTKVAWRREVLHTSGISDPALSNLDLVDAALGGLTGLLALEGNACWFGTPSEGVIVLPCRAIDVPARYPPFEDRQASPRGHSCGVCGHRYPTGSKYCNQCGRLVRLDSPGS